MRKVPVQENRENDFHLQLGVLFCTIDSFTATKMNRLIERFIRGCRTYLLADLTRTLLLDSGEEVLEESSDGLRARRLIERVLTLEMCGCSSNSFREASLKSISPVSRSAA